MHAFPRSLCLVLALLGAACVEAEPDRRLLGEPIPGAPTALPTAPATTVPTTPPAQTSAVGVTLTDFAVGVNPVEIPAGRALLTIANRGGQPHELRVLRTDHPPSGLPMFGPKADETAAGVALVGRVDPFPADAAKQLQLSLPAGRYVLICNIPDHYRQGMRTGLTVA